MQQINFLKDSWTHLFSAYSEDAALGEELWEEILRHYTGAKRHYHNLDHIYDLLQQAEQFKLEIRDIDVLRFSIWYHDIIYKSWRKDNELQSAILAQKRLKNLHLENEGVKHCYEQILLTKSHDTANAPKDDQWLIDFDLAILGRSWEEYAVYKDKVRQEFSIFPNFMYRKGRKKALQHFLDRANIYATPHYRSHFEETARANLQRELNELLHP